MAARPDQGRILVVGSEASARRVRLQANGEGEVELVDSLEEAAARYTTGNYARIVVDPAALKGMSLEVLAPAPESAAPSAELVSSQFPEPSPPPEAASQATTAAQDGSRSWLTLEDRLRKSESELAGVLENLDGGFIMLDSQWRFTRANTRAARNVGREPEELIGKVIWEEFPQVADTTMAQRYRRVMAERTAMRFEEHVVITDRWYSHDVYPTSEGIAVFWHDITERKQAEEALRASNERLALISDAVSRLLESDSPQEAVNDLCRRVMEHLGCQVFFNYLVIDEKDCLHLNACAGVPEETVESIEWLDYGEAICGCVTRNGCRIVAESISETGYPSTNFVAGLGVRAYACHPLLAESGRLLGTLSFGARTRTEFSEGDLTIMRTIADHVAIAITRLEAQEDLRRSEERFRTIFETAPAGIITIDFPEKRILTSNRALQDMLGYSAEELSAKTVRDITHPDDAEADVEPLKRLVDGTSDHFHLEKRYLRKDGEVVWTHLTGSVVRSEDGGLLYGIGLIEDITERKLAEDVQRRYELLADNSRDIILFVRREDGRILEANSAATEAYGYTREELLGLTILDLRSPETRDLAPVQTAEAEAHGILFETVHVRKNGETFPVEVGSRGANIGGTRVLISVVRDITDRKRLEGYREEMLKRERKIAETLQEAIVPAQIVSRQGDYAFYVVYEPAYKEAEIGGDFYDVFDLGDGKVGVLIGDVAGKGLAAAVHVAATRYAVRGYAYADPRPARVLAWANDVLCRESADESRTLTAFFAVVDTRLHTMTYASAGHEPPIAVDREGRCINLTSTGTLLGMLPETPYGEESLRIDDIERIVMVTDGITEARPPGGALFTEGGLTDYLLRNRTAPGPVVAVGLVAAAMEHAGGPLRDDAAVVVLERAVLDTR